MSLSRSRPLPQFGVSTSNHQIGGLYIRHGDKFNQGHEVEDCKLYHIWTMGKDETMRIEEAVSPYAGPFVEDKALERRWEFFYYHWGDEAKLLIGRLLWKVDIRLIPPLFIMVSSTPLMYIGLGS